MIHAYKLPYTRDLFVPVLSKESIDFHYDKHHLGYIKKLNNLIINTIYQDASLEKILLESYHKQDMQIFNNAAQVWNHDFYWKSISINSVITPDIKNLINESFTDFTQFRQEFINTGMSLFGSGWLWLVLDNTNRLRFITTTNAVNPLVMKLRPLVTVDLWEHAYYIDYRNDRMKYLSNIFSCLNWNFMSKNL